MQYKLILLVAVAVSVTAIMGTAFAQTSNSTQTVCGSQPYAYVACNEPTSSAQMYGIVIVGGIVALAIGCGAAGLRH